MVTNNEPVQQIPQVLKDLVYWSVKVLGQAIQQEQGQESYQLLERVRKRMKKLRGLDHLSLFRELKKEQKKFSRMTTSQLEELAVGFSYMLELINCCENAYRSYRLTRRDLQLDHKKPESIVLVLTAHPTESRSPEFLQIFAQIQKLLRRHLEKQRSYHEKELYHLLLLAFKVTLARKVKPSVSCEAQNIYAYSLNPKILASLIKFRYEGLNISIRAWVGGDKDGHPGVDGQTMIDSLCQSRSLLVDFILSKLALTENHLDLTGHKKRSALAKSLTSTYQQLDEMKTISNEDGKKVVRLKKKLESLRQHYFKSFSTDSPYLVDIKKLLEIFPALVVPLEIREDSSVVKQALTSPTPYAIESMLITLKKIAIGYKAKWYVRGFILSMTSNTQDIQNGVKLVQKVFRSYKIPVVPLFENKAALKNSHLILKDLFENDQTLLQKHQTEMAGYYEVMVGYSDSSKESGVLPSRLMIGSALSRIEKCLYTYKLKPIFFHGSGGSIERGGGPIEDQVRWMPKSALNVYKATIQGEMVARILGNENIFEAHIIKISNNLKQSTHNKKNHPSQALAKLSDLVAISYSQLIKDETFLKVIDTSTPYNFLSHLRIGSRPTKRSTGGDVSKLRAIPWILCWTQTRVLFPAWFGVGSSYEQLSRSEKNELKADYQTNKVFSCYMHALGFTLTRVELGVWGVYLLYSGLPHTTQKEVYSLLLDEYAKTYQFFKEVTSQDDLLWFRPWLSESIFYRSSMIHPLNLIQLEAIARKEMNLLVESVTGISCGMLTTG